MAEHSTDNSPLEIGAKMDYSEHNKTYDRFLALTKWGTIACVAILASMAFGFFVGGLFSGILLFVLILIAGYVLL